jgi:hypothetical protein
MTIEASRVISTILKHDRKVTSYKLALLRAINDVVLSFPDLRNYQQPVAIPLERLAEFWVAYYWPFVDAEQSIRQGQQSDKADMAFRPPLTEFRQAWEQITGGIRNPANGFTVIHELRVARKRATYPDDLLQQCTKTVSKIASTLQMPIRYAGVGEWTVFERPKLFRELRDRTIPVPGTTDSDRCLVISAELWQAFRELSLWVEALCIHEWCLFTERVDPSIHRGDVYTLLTARPDNRRPLTWESHNIDLMLMEGHRFICPWTERTIQHGTVYDLDHLLPLSVYPINELWNLLPANPTFNRNTKRDRIPSTELLMKAHQHLVWDYQTYASSHALNQALRDDVNLRFSRLNTVSGTHDPHAIADAVVDLIDQIADSRNLARF